MQDYQSNSHKSKEELANKPVAKKVVKGNVKVKKKTGLSKLSGAFIQEDARTVGSYVFLDVLIPAAKKLVYDVVANGLDMALNGNVRSNNSRTTGSYISYNKYSSNDRNSGYRSNINRGYSPDEIILSSRAEADEVLSQMDEIMETYGIVRVADLYDLVGVTGNYTDQKYGWTNIRHAETVRVRDGWVIKMPRAIPID